MTLNSIFNWLSIKLLIDEKKAVHEGKLFQLAIIIPIFLSIFFSITPTCELIESNDFQLSLSSSSLKEFVSYYSFSLSLLPLAVIFSLIIIRIHNSKQIISQTTLRNYYEHCEIFDKYCKYLEKSFGFEIQQRVLYKSLFSKSAQKSYNTEVTLEIARFYIKTTNEKSKFVGSVPNSDIHTPKVTIYSLKQDYLRGFRYYGISFPTKNPFCLNKLFELHKNLICELYQFEGIDISLGELKPLIAMLSTAEELSKNRIKKRYPKGLTTSDDYGSPIFIDGSPLS
ncbi:hypothetical protein I6F50_16470 [Pseudoalteromonas sp. NZS127_1]|uniref:hypothetical protein n=2 Tax=Pseudoalteromonas TaxID=53246 RepID=UPI0018CE79A3|nr:MULTISPECIES: hypothetical protein [unclassified Pseudoalteromonas]MBG9996651.1 hypothetical protein [Pseudoalteromonas sp. NZS127_1]MBH0019925.1 hypothetical protein [Pseudoalteromonas sp. SWXJ133]